MGSKGSRREGAGHLRWADRPDVSQPQVQPVVAETTAEGPLEIMSGAPAETLLADLPGRCFAYLLARFPGQAARIEEVPHEHEFVIGFQRDARNGPLLMFGLGGGDVGEHVMFVHVPLNEGQAQALVDKHVHAEAERDLVTSTVLAFQQLVLTEPRIVSLDLNPLAVGKGAVHFLDAKIHLVDQPAEVVGR
jgi:hypothetical protein